MVGAEDTLVPAPSCPILPAVAVKEAINDFHLAMSSPLTNVLTFASIPAAAVVLGGVAAAFRKPSPAFTSAVQHIAAGVLFAAVATELLPDVVHRRMPWVTLVGFALGVVAMLLLKELARRMETPAADAKPSSLPTSLMLVTGVDFALDGLLIGISFAAGARQGLLITVAMTLEVLFLGVAAAAAMTGLDVRRRVVVMTLAFATLLLSGAAAGTYFLAGADGVVLDAVMSFGVAALLFLVTEELLVEAHEVAETPLLTSMFFAGFLALLMIEMVI